MKTELEPNGAEDRDLMSNTAINYLKDLMLTLSQKHVQRPKRKGENHMSRTACFWYAFIVITLKLNNGWEC